MNKVKLWCYGGHDRYFFRSSSERIKEHNLRYSGIILAAMTIVTLVFFAFDLEPTVDPLVRKSFMICFIASAVLSVAHFLFLRKHIDKAGLYFCFIAELIFAFLVLVGPIQNPEFTAVFIPVFFLAMPLIPVIPWHIVFTLTLVNMGAFVWFLLKNKGLELGKTDIINAATCAFFGMVIGYSIFRGRLGEVAAYYQLKERSQSELSVALNSANTDPLTHVRSRVAYENAEHLLDIQIVSGNKPAFALVICDINWLKQTNDTFGHDMGDKLIRACCKIVCNVFTHSPVFRIGGDEFAVILQGEDLSHRLILMEMMAKELHYDQTGVSLACGMAVFNPQEDKKVDDVFKRADAVMYESKKRIKANRSFSESLVQDLK